MVSFLWEFWSDKKISLLSALTSVRIKQVDLGENVRASPGTNKTVCNNLPSLCAAFSQSLSVKRETPRQKQNAHACVAFWNSKIIKLTFSVTGDFGFFNNPHGCLQDQRLLTGFILFIVLWRLTLLLQSHHSNWAIGVCCSQIFKVKTILTLCVT